MRNLLFLSLITLIAMLSSCKSVKLPPFASLQWHVDAHTGKAVSDLGNEFAFGGEWLVTDTTLIQNENQLSQFPVLGKFLTECIGQFPEIVVDSIYFYNPNRGLLFASYHRVKPLIPTAEIHLYDESSQAYSPEYLKLYGQMYTFSDMEGWEKPLTSVFTNVRYLPNKKSLYLLQRIPYRGENVAVFHLAKTMPKNKKGKEGSPKGTFWKADLGDKNNIERVSVFLQASRNTAVKNLKLGSYR